MSEWRSSSALRNVMSSRVSRSCLLFAAILNLTAIAVADDGVTVQAGEKRQIVASDKPIKNRSDQLKGTVSIQESGGTPNAYTLSYLAPKETSNFSEVVKYSVDGSEHTVPVSVTASVLSTSANIYPEAFKALFVLFVVALILESGLAVIFSWRPFIELFDARGVKTIVSVVFAYVFVEEFHLDIVARLINIYSTGTPSGMPVGFPDTFITALVLAGGSSGINNLLVSLGFRSVKTAEEKAPKPPPTAAWISVRLIRKAAKGRVQVLIGPAGTLLVAGTISGSSRNFPIVSYFLRDFGRFPTAGGFPVTPGAVTYEVMLSGVDASGGNLSSKKRGPFALAAGSIVDIDLEL
jgi:hypothetical protein